MGKKAGGESLLPQPSYNKCPNTYGTVTKNWAQLRLYTPLILICILHDFPWNSGLKTVILFIKIFSETQSLCCVVLWSCKSAVLLSGRGGYLTQARTVYYLWIF